MEEITKTVWEEAPYKTLAHLIHSIDGTFFERNDIEQIVDRVEKGEPVFSQLLREEDYLTYDEYSAKYDKIHSDMEDETEDIQYEIDDLQEQIDGLEGEKSELEQPFREKLNALRSNYILSRRVLIYCLWKYYQNNREKWPRNHYSLGFPKGCLATAIQEQKDIGAFLKQVDDSKVIGDITSAFKDALNNGEIQRLISENLKTED